MTTLEALVLSIFRSFITKSVVRTVSSGTVFGSNDIVKELTVVLTTNGSITVNGVAFTALASVPQTFKFVNLATITANQNAAIIYYL